MGTPLTRALVAAYLEYAWTHLRRVPRPSLTALHLDLFDQPGENGTFSAYYLGRSFFEKYQSVQVIPGISVRSAAASMVLGGGTMT